ncbi:hypothetical protein CC79DRAFT_1330980 [Sarocladium strictum]
MYDPVLHVLPRYRQKQAVQWWVSLKTTTLGAWLTVVVVEPGASRAEWPHASLTVEMLGIGDWRSSDDMDIISRAGHTRAIRNLSIKMTPQFLWFR